MGGEGEGEGEDWEDGNGEENWGRRGSGGGGEDLLVAPI